jgi:Major Facilitator Superfamily
MAATPQMGRLLLYQATGAAGDALIAVALANSLFFQVPVAEARGKVALYLAFTIAPFAVVAPFLSRWLDRHRGGMRAVLVAAAVGRGTCAWLLATRLDDLTLFPLAFGVLVLSRAVLVVRGAYLPSVVPDGYTLVQANAALSKVSALAGMVAVVPGLAIEYLIGAGTELIFTAFVFYLGVIPALMLPAVKGKRSLDEQIDAREGVRSIGIRQASVAACGIRFLVGFLVFHLAFAMRREDFGSLQLGLLIASAATGTLFGAILAPSLRRALKEEGIMIVSLIAAGVAGLIAGRWFSVPSAAILVFVFGMTSGAAKVAFDSIVQQNTPEAGRGWAFARFESVLQLAWVIGALVPLVIPLSSGTGVIVAGVVAVALGLLYLVGRRKARQLALP